MYEKKLKKLSALYDQSPDHATGNMNRDVQAVRKGLMMTMGSLGRKKPGVFKPISFEEFKLERVTELLDRVARAKAALDALLAQQQEAEKRQEAAVKSLSEIHDTTSV